MTVDIGKLAGDYTKPGQFIQVKVGDTKPGFFAIASPPDPNNQGLVELLIKRQGDTAEAICAVAAGESYDPAVFQTACRTSAQSMLPVAMGLPPSIVRHQHLSEMYTLTSAMCQFGLILD